MLFQQKLSQSPRYEQEYSYAIGGPNKEYVPVFAMDQRVVPASFNVPPGDYNALINSEANKFNTESRQNAPIVSLIKKSIYSLNTDLHGGAGLHYFEEVEDTFNNVLPNAIEEYLNSYIDYSISFPTNHSGTSYDDLFNALNFNNWSTIDFRNNSILTNLHFCADLLRERVPYINQNGVSAMRMEYKIKPLFALVVKPEFIPYLRLCWLLGEEPNYSIFELWVDSEFDIKNTNWKFLRSKFRNLYLPRIESLGIDVRKVSNLMDKLFYKIQIPETVKTIKDKKDWINNVSKETLDILKTKANLQNTSITLIV